MCYLNKSVMILVKGYNATKEMHIMKTTCKVDIIFDVRFIISAYQMMFAHKTKYIPLGQLFFCNTIFKLILAPPLSVAR